MWRSRTCICEPRHWRLRGPALWTSRVRQEVRPQAGTGRCLLLEAGAPYAEDRASARAQRWIAKACEHRGQASSILVADS